MSTPSANNSTTQAPPTPSTSSNTNNNGNNGGGVHVPNTQVSVPPLPSTNVTPVDQALTLAQATVQCTLDGLNQALQPQAFQQCLDHYMHP